MPSPATALPQEAEVHHQRAVHVARSWPVEASLAGAEVAPTAPGQLRGAGKRTSFDGASIRSCLFSRLERRSSPRSILARMFKKRLMGYRAMGYRIAEVPADDVHDLTIEYDDDAVV